MSKDIYLVLFSINSEENNYIGSFGIFEDEAVAESVVKKNRELMESRRDEDSYIGRILKNSVISIDISTMGLNNEYSLQEAFDSDDER
jgi:hypothetical protein